MAVYKSRRRYAAGMIATLDSKAAYVAGRGLDAGSSINT